MQIKHISLVISLPNLKYIKKIIKKTKKNSCISYCLSYVKEAEIKGPFCCKQI